jgi:hypothetical protein
VTLQLQQRADDVLLLGDGELPVEQHSGFHRNSRANGNDHDRTTCETTLPHTSDDLRHRVHTCAQGDENDGRGLERGRVTYLCPAGLGRVITAMFREPVVARGTWTAAGSRRLAEPKPTGGAGPCNPEGNPQQKRPSRPEGREGRKSLQRNSGGGGTRTPKGLRPPHFECGALPIRTTPPNDGGPPSEARQSGRPDLNRRPLAPEASALPG